MLSDVNAQDLEPRAYTSIPRGLNIVLTGYNYSAGGVVFDPAIPLENANIHIHSSVFLGPVRLKLAPWWDSKIINRYTGKPGLGISKEAVSKVLCDT